MILEFNQYAYIVVLLLCTPVAFYSGARFVALVMWLNLLFTIQYSHAPDILGWLDFLSACLIVAVVRDRTALTVALIFCFMVFAYKLFEPAGVYTTYSIVEWLAYAQIFSMGAAGFGGGARRIRARLRNLHSHFIHSQKAPVDAPASGRVVVATNLRDVLGRRVNG